MLSIGSLTGSSPRLSTPPDNEQGFATPAVIASVALALYMFSALANLVVVQYAAGVVRSALDEGARAGSVGGVESCYAKIDEVFDGLLGGSYGDGVSVVCEVDESWMRVEALATFDSFVPLIPNMSYRFEAAAALEGL